VALSGAAGPGLEVTALETGSGGAGGGVVLEGPDVVGGAGAAGGPGGAGGPDADAQAAVISATVSKVATTGWNPRCDCRMAAITAVILLALA
jgi:hypothetical protein